MRPGAAKKKNKDGDYNMRTLLWKHFLRSWAPFWADLVNFGSENEGVHFTFVGSFSNLVAHAGPIGAPLVAEPPKNGKKNIMKKQH